MDIVVQHAELIAGPSGQGLWRIAVDLTRDGETEKVAAMVPADAIEWRIAQFNVDARTAIEMILVEPYVTRSNHEHDLAPTRSEARSIKAAMVTETLGGGSITWSVGPPGWTVSGPGGLPDAIADSGDGDPLQTIVELSPVDEEIVAVKREALELGRARLRARISPSGPRAAPPKAKAQLIRPTPDELRSRLLPPPPLEE